MKKFISFLFALTLFFPLLARAQNFPLLNGIYSANCDGNVKWSVYWAGSSVGGIVKYMLRSDGMQVEYSKQIVEKSEIINNKLSLQLRSDLPGGLTQSDVLEFGGGGSNYRTISRTINGQEIVRDGVDISDKSPTSVISRCEPNSAVSSQARPRFEAVLKDDPPSKIHEKIIDVKPKIYTSLKDIPPNEAIQFKALSKELKRQVCKGIEKIHVAVTPNFMTNEYNITAYIYKGGGGAWYGNDMRGEDCMAFFYLDGYYKGSNYKAKAACPVKEIEKRDDIKKYLWITAIDDQSCAKVN